MNAIIEGSEANGGSLTPLLMRVEMWVNDLGRIRQKAQNMACADQKAEWLIGPTEQHCPTCSFYAGKVYRRSVWIKYLEPLGLLPRTKGPESGLACGGWQCLCDLVNTNKPVTPGRPPIWKGPKTPGRPRRGKILGAHRSRQAQVPA